MADPPGARVVLRYFEAQGRAQPLRHALAAGGVAFEDELVYADLVYPGADLTKAFAFLVGGMAAKLSGVESIPAPGAWIGGASPVVADFLAAEAFELMSYLLGPDRLLTLRAKLPKLTALAARVRELPALAREWERRPSQFTARADERVAVERIRSVL